MARTTIDVDEGSLAAAQAVLGTTGLSATINAALRDVVSRRVLEDFDVLRDVDGSAEELAMQRAERGPDTGR